MSAQRTDYLLFDRARRGAEHPDRNEPLDPPPSNAQGARRHRASRRHLRRSRRLTLLLLVGLVAATLLVVYLGVSLGR